MYRGTKFNGRMEVVKDEDYLGIRIFRFYMKCMNCSAMFSIKTDPKNADYVCELNCSRQVEHWKEQEDEREALIEKRVAQEEGDVMKELENKTMDSKMEMDILDALDEIKSLNARASVVDIDALLERRKEEEHKLDDEDEMKIIDTFEGGGKRLHEDEKFDMSNLLKRRKRKTDESRKQNDVEVKVEVKKEIKTEGEGRREEGQEQQEEEERKPKKPLLGFLQEKVSETSLPSSTTVPSAKKLSTVVAKKKKPLKLVAYE